MNESDPQGKNCKSKDGRPKGISKYLWLMLQIALVYLITNLLPAAIVAQETDAPDTISTSRPDPEGVPTKVSVGLFVINIESVSGAEQSFTANFVLGLTWKDPRLACKSGEDPNLTRKFKLDQVWDPQIFILNQRRVFKQEKEIVMVGCEGNVEYSQIYYGDFLTFADISDFPFDERPLKIDIVSREYGPDDVEFILNERFSGRAEEISIADWYISRVPTTQSAKYLIKSRQRFQDEALSRFIFEFNADRNTRYYTWKVIFPMFLIVFMSWTVFWIPPTQIGPQIGLSVTSMLTLIAYRFAIGNITPNVDYLTRFDKFVFGSTLLIFLALVEAVATGSLSVSDRGELAQKIDWFSRIFFPTAFVLVVLYAFLL